MQDESQLGATLIIRAWRGSDGKLTARITYGVDGKEPALEIASARSELEVMAVLRDWMDKIGMTDGGPNGPSGPGAGAAP
jgi:hypothetical protein